MGNLIGTRVQFQTDICSEGEGLVTAHNEETETIEVRDDEGQLWHGTEDLIRVVRTEEARSFVTLAGEREGWGFRGVAIGTDGSAKLRTPNLYVTRGDAAEAIGRLWARRASAIKTPA